MLRARAATERSATAIAATFAALAVASAAIGVRPPVEPPGFPPRVTMIADSTGAILLWAPEQRQVVAQGLDFRLDATACRKLVSPGCFAYGGVPSSALDVIHVLGSDVGEIAVIDVGYNDSEVGYADGIDAVMSALMAAGVGHVVWITLRETHPAWVSINMRIRAAAARWPQLTVADWAPLAAQHPSWFADDAHMNAEGAVGFAAFLRPVLLTACGPACTPPLPLAAMLLPVIRGAKATLRWQGDERAVRFDVETSVAGSTWRRIASQFPGTSVAVGRRAGERIRARVRAYDEDGRTGPWSPSRLLTL